MGERVRHRPRLTHRSSQALIYDGFLPEEHFRAVQSESAAADYNLVRVKPGLTKGHGPHDESALRAGTVIYRPQAEGSSSPAPGTYPTGTAFDLFIEQILAMLPDNYDFVGRPSVDWQSISVTPWVYPAGAGLAVHADGEMAYSGGYAYFLHSSWMLHWGGHLLIFDPRTPPRTPHAGLSMSEKLRRVKALLNDEESEDERFWEPGLALCVLPKPNRMVFLSPGAPHMVSKVDPSAGDNLRRSLIGFFGRTN